MIRMNWGELFAGLAVTAFGAFLVLMALDLPLGSMRRPGPGAVPMGVGLIVAALGLAAAMRGARQGIAAQQGIRLRPLATVAVALIGFALLAETAGFVLATIFVVMVAGAGEGRDNWLALAGIAVALGLAGAALFIRLLGVPLPVLPQF